MSLLKTNTSFAEIGRLVQAHSRFAIASHVRPDGDAIGSVLGLGLSLKKLGKDVVMLNEDGIPANLAFLPRTDLVQLPGAPLEGIEVAFFLDTASQVRVGDGVTAALAGAAKLVNIDHHISNPGYGDLHYIDANSPAAGQIIYELLHDQKFPVDAEIAENLYTAISTDTGSFQYSATTATTYRIAADLVECGLDIGTLNEKIYQSHPLRRTLLLKELLNVLQLSCGDRCASWALTQDMAARAGAEAGDTENLIDNLRSIEGVVVAAFFEELPDGKIRISLRSKDAAVDVSQICQLFGGGGHRMAAGARLAGPLTAAQDRVLTAIHEALARRD